MCVALTPSAMRLSEAITIYLAAGASFGVYNFLREPHLGRRFHALLKATRAAILWPLVAAKILFFRQRPGEGGAVALLDKQMSMQLAENTGHARRKLLASLYKFVELAQASSGRESARVEAASRAARETIEKYVGLTLAAAEINPDASPTERELEICRVAGRRGDDLLIAGRCIHRRNAARLVAHQARARTELLHALAEMREIVGGATALTNVVAARHLSVAALRFYCHAFNLLSLLEDEAAATIIARLMDAECGRLRRLEALSLKETRATEEELCTAHAPHLPMTGRSQTRALNQG